MLQVNCLFSKRKNRGYKYHEIAEKLDLPLGTIKSRIFFARQELQKALKDFRYA